LKVATTFWHIGGMAALTVGCDPVTREARGVGGAVGTRTFAGGPRNMARGAKEHGLWTRERDLDCTVIDQLSDCIL
jgi:hypothetical protein